MRRFLTELGSFYDAHGALSWGVLAFLLILLVLYTGRPIGLSDNGDFKRVMDASSLAFTENNAAYAYNGAYKIVLGNSSAARNTARILFGGEGFDQYPSLQVPLVRVSVVLNLLLDKLTGSDRTVYRLEVLGVLHSLLYAAVLAFLSSSFKLKRRGADVLAKALLLFVLCDAGYLTYFNSFYGEALQLIVFVFIAALFVRILSGRPGVMEAVLSALGCVAFGWSKFYNIPAACVLVVLLEGLIVLRSRRKPAPAGITPRKGTAGFAAAACAAALAVLAAVWAVIPTWMGAQTKFNAVFFGILREADVTEAEQALAELGLPAEMAKYRSTNIYVDGVAAELEKNGTDSAVRSVSNVKLAAYYLKHPGALLRALEISRLNAGSIRPFYLGNEDSSAPKLTFSHRFSLWSDARVWLGFDSAAGAAGILLAFGLCLFFLMRRQGWRRLEAASALVLLAGVCAYFFIGPFISNGEGDLSKHLFAFAQMSDLMVLCVLLAALSAFGNRRHSGSAVLSGLLALSLLAAPLGVEIRTLFGANRSHGALENGAYVTFGTYRGTALLWRVTETVGGTATLIACGTVSGAPFSPDGNAWEASSLRVWLNGDFLNSFTPSERSRIVPVSHAVLLSREAKSTAEAGSRDFYFSQVPSLAARGASDAYRRTLRDAVLLPDIALISTLAMSGQAITLGEAYWLETPYFNNGYMVRCVMPDGTVLMREASGAAGVRPVVHVDGAGITAGGGSRSNPFVLS